MTSQRFNIKTGGSAVKKWMAILWPSFLMAGVAEGVFFSLINPQELYLLGKEVAYPALATYSLGFFSFWALCAISSALTSFLEYSNQSEQPGKRSSSA
jgi:hypothetical protein